MLSFFLTVHSSLFQRVFVMVLALVCSSRLASATETPLPSGTFEVPSGLPALLIGATWETPTDQAPKLRLTRPDGTAIRDSDIITDPVKSADPSAPAGSVALVEELSSRTSRVLVVKAPMPGRWLLGLAEPRPELGTVGFDTILTEGPSATSPTPPAAPAISVEWVNLPKDITVEPGGELELVFRLSGTSAKAVVSVGLDDDRAGFDGIQLTRLTRRNGEYHVRHKPEARTSGTFHPYVTVVDFQNLGVPQTRAYAPAAVSIQGRAQLLLRVAAPPSPIKPGGVFEIVAAIENSGPVASGPVEIALEVPAQAQLHKADPAVARTNGPWQLVTLPSVAPDKTVFATYQLRAAPEPGQAALRFALRVRAQPGEWETGEADQWTGQVLIKGGDLADLAVSRSPLVGAARVGQSASYTVTVANAGPATAKNVTLQEYCEHQLRAVTPSQGAGRIDPKDFGRAEVLIGDLPAGQSATVEFQVRTYAYGQRLTTSVLKSDTPDPQPANDWTRYADKIETAPDPAEARATPTQGVTPAQTGPSAPVEAGTLAASANASAPVTLLADRTFEKSAGWQRDSWRPSPATIVGENGNRFLQIVVPQGRSMDVFAPAKIAPGLDAVRLRFRARCQVNPEPSRPVLMFLLGTRDSSTGKPVKLFLSPEWRWYDVVIRFRASPENNLFSITTVASPLAVDIDDLTFSPVTPEEAVRPTPREGPLAQP
jgi:uncharacterized repeat protein (TIGR01451 family)